MCWLASLVDEHGHSFIFGDCDYHEAGRLIGSDVVTCRSTGRNTGRCDVAAALSRGLILGTCTIVKNSNRFVGRITGGTGACAGASGTITGQDTRTGGDVELNFAD